MMQMGLYLALLEVDLANVEQESAHSAPYFISLRFSIYVDLDSAAEFRFDIHPNDGYIQKWIHHPTMDVNTVMS
jgi:hypothetical protein